MSEQLMEAARRGLLAGGERLAAALRDALGGEVTVAAEAGGIVVRVSAAGLAAREFGTAGRAPEPVVGTIVAALGARIAADVVSAMGENG
ncbi:MAG: hypothetical protein NT133_15425 [Alphaproteobacteria bacterium]|nr:hypothetical protein [Alphaproteobacteria bacterium]